MLGCHRGVSIARSWSLAMMSSLRQPFLTPHLTCHRFADYVGLSKYVTPKLVWQLQTGRVEDRRVRLSKHSIHQSKPWKTCPALLPPTAQELSSACEHGTRMEPVVRGVYERMLDHVVVPGGFGVHPRLSFLGASPDGLVGHSGLVEFKAPIFQVFGMSPRESSSASVPRVFHSIQTLFMVSWVRSGLVW